YKVRTAASASPFQIRIDTEKDGQMRQAKLAVLEELDKLRAPRQTDPSRFNRCPLLFRFLDCFFDCLRFPDMRGDSRHTLLKFPPELLHLLPRPAHAIQGPPGYFQGFLDLRFRQSNKLVPA